MWRTAFALGLIAAPSFAHEAPPNVLLVLADDMGLDASRCYQVGQSQAPMPVLERLCDNGLVFDSAYAYPVCSPTRAAIMTGRPATQTGIGGAVNWGGSATGLSADTPSLFDAVSTAGYASALIGKWHLATKAEGLNHPAELGVSTYFGMFRGAVQDYFNWTAVENGQEVQIDGYSTTVLTDRAIDWIGAQDGPWFLWLAYNAPHAPFHLPPIDLHSFKDLPETGGDDLDYYNAALEALDTEMGRLLAGLDDNTVVIFMGDNGTPNQIAREFYAPNGAKGALFEGGVHVPLVIAGAGIPPSRTKALVQPEDLFATIAALTGVSVSAPFAVNQIPVLMGREGPRKAVTLSHFSDTPARGPDTYGWLIRQGTDALVSIDGEAPKLFDLGADPLELRDLMADEPTASAQALAESLTQTRDTLLGKPAQ